MNKAIWVCSEIDQRLIDNQTFTPKQIYESLTNQKIDFCSYSFVAKIIKELHDAKHIRKVGKGKYRCTNQRLKDYKKGFVAVCNELKEINKVSEETIPDLDKIKGRWNKELLIGITLCNRCYYDPDYKSTYKKIAKEFNVSTRFLEKILPPILKSHLTR